MNYQYLNLYRKFCSTRDILQFLLLALFFCGTFISFSFVAILKLTAQGTAGDMAETSKLEDSQQCNEFIRDFAETIKASKDSKIIEEFYHKLLLRCPNSPGAHFSLGQVYFDLKKYELAVKSFDTALALKKDAELYLGLGNAKYSLGQYPEALFSFVEAIKIDQKNIYALNGAALVCIKQNKLAEADEFLRKALVIKPKEVLTLKNLAGLEEKKGNFSDSIDLLLRAAKEQPSDGDLILDLVRLYLKFEDFENAIMSFERVKFLKSNPAYLKLITAMIEEISGKFEESQKTYAELVSQGELKAADEDKFFSQKARINLALLKVKQGLAQEGVDILKKEDENLKGDYGIRSALLWVYLRLGKIEESKKIAEIVATHPQSSQDPYFFNNLAVLQELVGEQDNARTNYKKALSLNSNFIAAKENLTRVNN